MTMNEQEPTTLIAKASTAKAKVEALEDAWDLTYDDLGVCGDYLGRCAHLLHEADRCPNDYDIAAVAVACSLQGRVESALRERVRGRSSRVELREMIAKHLMAKHDYIVVRGWLYRREDGELVNADDLERIEDELKEMRIRDADETGLAMGVRGWITDHAARLAYDAPVPSTQSV